MESKLILAFHVAPQKLGKIRFCAMKMGMRVMDVPLADCGQTLGALCGKAERQTDAAAPENAVGSEMLYFAFSELPLVERFLTTMKQMRGPPVRLKGVMTETNLAWTPAQLYEELTREHQAMAGHGAPIHAAKQEE